jgi:hypothetical protein
MFKRRFRLPSPALVVSMITLSLVLGGTAFAATTATHKDKKADTKLIKKLAPTLSVKHAKTANNATNAVNATNATHATSANTATSATNATNATNASNAANLGGLAPSAYQPKKKWVFVNADGTIAQQSGGITVQTEPPGFYYIDWGTSIVGSTITVELVWPYVGEVNTLGCGHVSTSQTCDLSDNNHTWFVGTYDTSGTATNMQFYATLNG